METKAWVVAQAFFVAACGIRDEVGNGEGDRDIIAPGFKPAI
jgi:hypothetical protein